MNSARKPSANQRTRAGGTSLVKSLQGVWLFNDHGAGRFPNVARNGPDGTPAVVQSGALSAPSPYGRSLKSTTAQDGATVAYNAGFNGTGGITFMVRWMSTNLARGVNQHIFTKPATSNDTFPWVDWEFYLSGAGLLRVSTTNNDVSTNFTPVSGIWYTSLATFDGTNRRVYIAQDGRYFTDFAADANLPANTSSQPLRFGSYTAGTQGFDGYVDFGAVWSRALSIGEAEEVVRNPNSLFYRRIAVPQFAVADAAVGAIIGSSAGTCTVTGAVTGAGAIVATAACTCTVTGAVTGAGAMAATAAGTCTVTGAVTGAAAIAATAAGTVTVTGAATGAAAIAATSAGTCTVTGAVVGAGAIAATSAGTSTVTGEVQGIYPIDGTSAGTSTVAGAVTGAAAIAVTTACTSTVSGDVTAEGSVACAAAGTSTVTGAVTGAGAISVTVAGTCTVAGAVTGDAAISATSAGTCTVTGSAGVDGVQSGSAAGTSTATGSAVGDAAIAASAAGTVTVTGDIVGAATIAATAAGTCTVTGAAIGAADIAATSAGTSTGTGAVVGAGALSATSAGIATATATITVADEGSIIGASTGTSTVAAAITGAAAIASSASCTSTATAAITGQFNLQCSTSGTSTATGDPAGYGFILSTVAGTCTVTGAVTGSASVSATSAGTSTTTCVIAGAGSASCTAAGTSTTTASGNQFYAATGSSDGTSTVVGTMLGSGVVTSTIANTSTVTAVVFGAGRLVGTSAGTSVALIINVDTALHGTCDGTAVVTGTITSTRPDLSLYRIDQIAAGTVLRVILPSVGRRTGASEFIRVLPNGDRHSLNARTWNKIRGTSRRNFVSRVISNDTDAQEITLSIADPRSTKTDNVFYEVVMPYTSFMRASRLVPSGSAMSAAAEAKFRRKHTQRPLNKQFFHPFDRFVGVELIAYPGNTDMVVNFTYQLPSTGTSWTIPLPASALADSDYTVTATVNTAAGTGVPLLAIPDATRTAEDFVLSAIGGASLTVGTTIDFHVKAR